MADFEQACAERSLPLFILPPRSPKWNGRMERCNDTVRLEFRSLWDGDLTVSAVSEALARHQRWHNRERPHSALGFATPMEQLAKLQKSSWPPELQCHNQRFRTRPCIKGTRRTTLEANGSMNASMSMRYLPCAITSMALLKN